MPLLGGNGERLPGPQKRVSKGSVSRLSPVSCLEEAGSRARPVKQPVPSGCDDSVSPSIEHITDVKRSGAAANINYVQMHGAEQPAPGAGPAGLGLPARSCSSSSRGRGRACAALPPTRQAAYQAAQQRALEDVAWGTLLGAPQA